MMLHIPPDAAEGGRRGRRRVRCGRGRGRAAGGARRGCVLVLVCMLCVGRLVWSVRALWPVPLSFLAYTHREWQRRRRWEWRGRPRAVGARHPCRGAPGLCACVLRLTFTTLFSCPPLSRAAGVILANLPSPPIPSPVRAGGADFGVRGRRRLCPRPRAGPPPARRRRPHRQHEPGGGGLGALPAIIQEARGWWWWWWLREQQPKGRGTADGARRAPAGRGWGRRRRRGVEGGAVLQGGGGVGRPCTQVR